MKLSACCRTFYLFSSFFILIRSEDEPDCESCLFNQPPNREGAECAVYSTFGNATLQAWYRANETCLEALNISNAAIPKERMWQMCPNPNRNDASVTILQIFLRDINSTATQRIKSVILRDFFDPDTFEFMPVIAGHQGSVDCEQSDDLCWNEVSVFLELDSRALDDSCLLLHQMQRASMTQEQAMAREAVCISIAASGGNPNDLCSPLLDQVRLLIIDANTCNDFGRVDYGSLVPPNCSFDNEGGNDGENTDRSSASAALLSFKLDLSLLMATVGIQCGLWLLLF